MGMGKTMKRWGWGFMLIASTAMAAKLPNGNREGNGGDHIRGTFIKMGRVVLAYLTETNEGLAIVEKHRLSISALRETLDIAVIKVVPGTLVDNGGSLVDATGIRGSIRLLQETWLDHFEKERDVYYLVFHEMARAAGYNDDNYVISGAINPFPHHKRIATRITPKLPLIEGELIQGMLRMDEAIWEGEACPRASQGTYLDFDPERNILELTPGRFTFDLIKFARPASRRQACNFAIPIQVPTGKRLRVTQLDVLSTIFLPLRGSAHISVEVFEAGKSSAVLSKTVTPSPNALGRTLMRMSDVFASECGSSSLLRLSAVQTISSLSVVEAILDFKRISFYLKLEDCASPDIVADFSLGPR